MFNAIRQWVYSKTWRPLLPCIFRRHNVIGGECEYGPMGECYQYTPDYCSRCGRTEDECDLEDGTLPDRLRVGYQKFVEFLPWEFYLNTLSRLENWLGKHRPGWMEY